MLVPVMVARSNLSIVQVVVKGTGTQLDGAAVSVNVTGEDDRLVMELPVRVMELEEGVSVRLVHEGT